jgi:hypothetical protein
MKFTTLVLLTGFLITTIPLFWKGVKWWVKQIDNSYEPLRPKIWKLHNRLSGWTGVVLLLIYSAILWSKVQAETGYFQAYYMFLSYSILLCAGIFAITQYKVWKRGEYFLKPVKVGHLDDLFYA